MATNDEIRAAMKAKMAANGITQAMLAERLRVKQPTVAGILSRNGPRVPVSLLRALDALDLELIVVPKTTPPAPEAEES